MNDWRSGSSLSIYLDHYLFRYWGSLFFRPGETALAPKLDTLVLRTVSPGYALIWTVSLPCYPLSAVGGALFAKRMQSRFRSVKLLLPLNEYGYQAGC